MNRLTDELVTGIDEIDSQHREMFDVVDRLLSAAKHGEDTEEVKKVIAFLEGYVLRHFSMEEGYMDRYEYPESEPHKERHRDFLREFLKLRYEFKKNEATSYIALVIEGWLYGWLKSHFGNEDRLLGAFLKKKMGS